MIEQGLDVASHELHGAVVEQRLGRAIRKSDLTVGITHEKGIRHRADNFRRCERRRDALELGIPQRPTGGQNETDNREVSEWIEGEAEIRQVVDTSDTR